MSKSKKKQKDEGPKIIDFFSASALGTLNKKLYLKDTRPRYSDEILSAFQDLLQKRYSDKKKDIERKSGQLRDLYKSLHKGKVFQDPELSQTIKEAEDILAADKKILEKYQFALNRIANKNYGICFKSNKLIALEELLANPVAKWAVAYRLAM